MKYLFLLTLVLFSCKVSTSKSDSKMLRKNFTLEEQEVIKVAKNIMENTYFGTFITIDEEGQPRARVMEPFAPDDEFIIWLATNPKSRKVAQITSNPQATIHYFDKEHLGYVSLMGHAFLVNDKEIKATKWKDGWENFYPNKDKDFLLIKFVPNTLELISVPNKYTGDSINWKPHSVNLR